jgi:hypothetical protein
MACEKELVAYKWCILMCMTRWLHPDDPQRSQGVGGQDNGSGFTKEEHGVPPEPRTHDESQAQGWEAENFKGPSDSDNHPKKGTGIGGWCPLGDLPLFDIIWDICPDMMHIIKNMFERFFISLPDGERIPKAPKKTFKPPRANEAGYAAKLRANRKECARHEEATKRAKICTYSATGKKQFDIRYR